MLAPSTRRRATACQNAYASLPFFEPFLGRGDCASSALSNYPSPKRQRPRDFLCALRALASAPTCSSPLLTPCRPSRSPQPLSATVQLSCSASFAVAIIQDHSPLTGRSELRLDVGWFRLVSAALYRPDLLQRFLLEFSARFARQLRRSPARFPRRFFPLPPNDDLQPRRVRLIALNQLRAAPPTEPDCHARTSTQSVSSYRPRTGAGSPCPNSVVLRRLRRHSFFGRPET